MLTIYQLRKMVIEHNGRGWLCVRCILFVEFSGALKRLTWFLSPSASCSLPPSRCLYLCLSWIRLGYRLLCAGLISLGHRLGAAWTPPWMPLCIPLGNRLDAAWGLLGFRWVPSGYLSDTVGMPRGYCLHTAWIPLGHRLDAIPLAHGLDTAWVPPWTLPGYRLHTAWVPLGYRLDAAWNPPGFRCDTAGITLWMSLGYRWDNAIIPLGICFGCRLDAARNTLGVPLGVPLVLPKQAALQRAEEAFPDTVERLRELCAFGPRDGKACADKVGEKNIFESGDGSRQSR